ncbi:DUF7006 family protein [Candidatus Enterococcus clewellii]|uniref:Uncharacterized protein n=1 Tax=Candidatus Enterococcus clewellii TaxID=1834193 RepID=A0A242KDI6_9ENTE|nr:hypothetical protein [Enterococcus sp. 9E7_DIV0242]OTP19235.1 hypothetical protein A5888_001050 [Enterococcus sp. 9E7_DIV0242]
MAFSWELELTNIYAGEIDHTLRKYYEKLQEQAIELVEKINADNFSKSLSILQGIDEKCQLLFFFLEHTEDLWFETSVEVIDCIEGEYKRSYLEKLPFPTEYGKNSLLYMIR